MPRKKKNNNKRNDFDDDGDDDQSSLSTLSDHYCLSTSHNDSTTRTSLATHASTATVVEQDTCWDGCWLADGLHGMFLHLTIETNSNPTAVHDDTEFVRLDMDQQDQEGWERLYRQILEPRNLQIAAGIVRRISEGTCPTQLPIRTLSADDVKLVQEKLRAGDRALDKKKYQKAIAKYKCALEVVPNDFFVAPAEQMEDVAEILCSTAQAYLALAKYNKAGKAATACLLFVGNHETARLWRAKAAVALQSAPYLIQAKMDLQEMLHNNAEPTQEEEHEAEEILQTQLGPLLRIKCQEFQKDNPNANWQVWVESIQAKCWWLVMSHSRRVEPCGRRKNNNICAIDVAAIVYYPFQTQVILLGLELCFVCNPKWLEPSYFLRFNGKWLRILLRLLDVVSVVAKLFGVASLIMW